MSKEELEENSSEEQLHSDVESKEEEGSNTEPKKEEKKFDVWKEYKKLKKENKILKTTADEDLSDEEKEAEANDKGTDISDDVKFDIFLLKNSDAQEYGDEIKQTIAKFPNMSYEEAFSFSKANYTKSASKKDFSTKSATPKKELKDYSQEEILQLKDKKKLLEWSRLQGRVR